MPEIFKRQHRTLIIIRASPDLHPQQVCTTIRHHFQHLHGSTSAQLVYRCTYVLHYSCCNCDDTAHLLAIAHCFIRLIEFGQYNRPIEPRCNVVRSSCNCAAEVFYCLIQHTIHVIAYACKYTTVDYEDAAVVMTSI